MWECQSISSQISTGFPIGNLDLYLQLVYISLLWNKSTFYGRAGLWLEPFFVLFVGCNLHWNIILNLGIKVRLEEACQHHAIAFMETHRGIHCYIFDTAELIWCTQGNLRKRYCEIPEYLKVLTCRFFERCAKET